jgi:hypothetical protein
MPAIPGKKRPLKRLELLDLRRNGEFSNDSNMFVQGLDTRSIHMVTEKIHCQDRKKAHLAGLILSLLSYRREKNWSRCCRCFSIDLLWIKPW